MTKLKKTLSILTTAAVAVTMASCGSQAGAADAPAAAGNVAAVSPLNAILNQVWGSDLSQEEQQRQLDEESMLRQELIAQCMNEAGFEYIPNPNAGGTVIVWDDDTWQPNNREWVAQWGYGVINSPSQALWEAQEQAQQEAGTEIPTDPNQAIRESMSEAEAQAWQEALWGPPFEELPEGLVTEDGVVLDSVAFHEAGGCEGRAWNITNANSAFGLLESDEFRPLMDAMNEMHANIQNTPEWLNIDLAWANCMADAGYTGFNTQWDAQNSIWDAQNDLWADLGDWDWEQGTPNANTNPAWAELAEREVELALTDLDCRVSVDHAARQQAVQFAAETAFVNDHRAMLDALVAAVESR